MQVTNQLHK